MFDIETVPMVKLRSQRLKNRSAYRLHSNVLGMFYIFLVDSELDITSDKKQL